MILVFIRKKQIILWIKLKRKLPYKFIQFIFKFFDLLTLFSRSQPAAVGDLGPDRAVDARGGRQSHVMPRARPADKRNPA